MASSPPPPHAVILPFPAQGHVIPLMELSYSLLQRGVKVTILNTHTIHRRIIAAAGSDAGAGHLRMLSYPDGLDSTDERNDPVRVMESCRRTIPPFLAELIRNQGEQHKLTWMIAHMGMAWSLSIARALGLRTAAFATSSAASVALIRTIPRLLHDSIIDENGEPKKDETIKLSPGMPPMKTTELMWNHLGSTTSQRIAFRGLLKDKAVLDTAELVLCNSSADVEPPAFAMVPDMIPIGPLLSVRRMGRSAGSFWKEDVECLAWLDMQRPGSVVYVAFGSNTVFGRRQFEELVVGLELAGKPFLWVVRPGFMSAAAATAAEEEMDECCVGDRGRIVEWAPQEMVLGHPSTGCFMSHCGWNSTMEGLANGVPFLCWPYFADQFLNQSYICDVWRVGTRMVFDGDTGIVSREQIKEKVEEVLGDEEMKTRAVTWKEEAERSVGRGGSSYENLERLVIAMQEDGTV